MKHFSVQEYLDLQRLLQLACDATDPLDRHTRAQSIYNHLTESSEESLATASARLKAINQQLQDELNQTKKQLAGLDEQHKTATRQLSKLAQELAAVKKYRDERTDVLVHMESADKAARDLALYFGYMKSLVKI